jgi:hypothetical protein
MVGGKSRWLNSQALWVYVKVLSLYPSLFLCQVMRKLVRTGFPSEVADASASISGRKPK